MKHLVLVLIGMVGVGWTFAATNDTTFADSNARLLPLRRDVVRLMAASLAAKDVHVALAQNRSDDFLRDLLSVSGIVES